MEKIKITVDDAKRIQNEILIYFNDFCNKHGLKMYLYAGTLLGAVRHKGFIPWDDDIDVCMSRSDYNKLLSLIDELDDDYVIASRELNKKYLYPFGKIYKKNTSCVEFHNPKFCGIDLGIYVDIFPIDYVGDTIEEANANCNFMLERIYESMNYLHHIPRGNILTKNLRRIKNFIKNNPIKRKKNFKIIDEFMHKYEKPTKYSAVVAWVNSSKTILETSQYAGGVELTFEGRTYLSYDGHIEFLEKLFGDYMTLPPVEQREVHGFDSYIYKK